MLSNEDDLPDLPELPEWIKDLAARAERPVTHINGAAIQWHVWGEGKPLVLNHGGHGSWRHWVRNIEALSKHFRVMAVDLPSFGESGVYLTDDLQDYASVVAAGVDELAPGEPISMAGFSFGSVIGALMLKYVSAGVDAFAMLGSPMLGRVHPVTGQLVKWRGLYNPVERAAAHGTNVGALMLTGPESVTDEAIAIQMSHAELASGRYRGLFRLLDVPAEIKAWPGKLTVIYGDHDAITCRHLDERRAKVAEIKPDAEFHIIEGAGHWVPYQAADRVNEILLERLK